MGDQREKEANKQPKDLEAEEDPKGGRVVDQAARANQNTADDDGKDKQGLIVTD